MKSKKILIIGDGYLGKNTYSFLKNNYITNITTNKNKKASLYCDITNYENVFKVIKKNKPDIIFLAAALNSLAKCEEDPRKAERINFFGVKNIVDSINKLNKNIKFIFPSSDYVFKGDRGNYKENDILEPTTIYGKLKTKAELYIKQNLKSFIIFRTANVFGNGGNFFEFLKDKILNDVKIEVFNDVFYTPTYINELLFSLKKLLDIDYIGIIHIAGKEKISRYKFALKLCKALGKDEKLIKPIKLPKGGLILKNSSLNTNKLLSMFNIIRSSIEKNINYSVDNLIYPYFYFSDKRGLIKGITETENIKEINYIETKKNTIRGNHYHKETTELFFIIDGKIKVKIEDANNNNDIKEFFIEKNDVIKIPVFKRHTFKTITNCKWINMLDKPISKTNDIYK